MKHFLILFAALCLCLGLHAAPAIADTDDDSDCPGNSCNAPPGQGGDSSADADAAAFASAYAQAYAFAYSQAYSNAVGIGGAATGVGSVIVEGDDFKAPDLAKTPGTPGSVGVNACGSGFSISAPGVGATGTKPSRFCHLLTLSKVYQDLGERAGLGGEFYLEIASELREEARSNVKRRGRFTRFLHLDEFPIIGWLFFRD